ncbi:hypothetical protein ECZC01_38610 [Escherichia coli]|uniref:hypothetical protein n=1 Tax=Escherichia coli TaxID=562 RepID=UPI000FBBF99E|nr:hypothetical protein [Escherichia coli]EFP2709049.1 hypothetical protein [Escherichia coli]EHV2548292.1 hypothetical protein [Escherichia coli]MGR14979.1 hypothetical protein [Escherichia coli]GJH47655.1 hypothetical protein ECZC01_38610 [Escherichia coli]
MNYEEGNNIHTEIEFFSLTIFFLKTTISLEIIKDIIKIGQKISCAIRKIYGNSLGIPSNKMQEKTK